ncbi:hypothetical protein MA16_Dca021494 [Dendrobium catenatum]|uniref:Uncharacterized protein n=1 Tax=Dendrobium catenatum TaxID=906689 RepID=A0A2I0VQC9_9ASPA|nr:hypothetical protein MA16_Dca021494 [Dendrobium catenatum]
MVTRKAWPAILTLNNFGQQPLRLETPWTALEGLLVSKQEQIWQHYGWSEFPGQQFLSGKLLDSNLEQEGGRRLKRWGREDGEEGRQWVVGRWGQRHGRPNGGQRQGAYGEGEDQFKGKRIEI